jgi:hypothetical protein
MELLATGDERNGRGAPVKTGGAHSNTAKEKPISAIFVDPCKARAHREDVPGFDALRDPPLQPVSVLAGDEQRDVFEAPETRSTALHEMYVQPRRCTLACCR